MRILIPGGIKSSGNAGGFIMLHGLLVMFVVIMCFAAVMAAMAMLSRQGSRLLENVQQEISARNEIVLKRVNQ